MFQRLTVDLQLGRIGAPPASMINRNQSVIENLKMATDSSIFPQDDYGRYILTNTNQSSNYELPKSLADPLGSTGFSKQMSNNTNTGFSKHNVKLKKDKHDLYMHKSRKMQLLKTVRNINNAKQQEIEYESPERQKEKALQLQLQPFSDQSQRSSGRNLAIKKYNSIETPGESHSSQGLDFLSVKSKREKMQQAAFRMLQPIHETSFSCTSSSMFPEQQSMANTMSQFNDYDTNAQTYKMSNTSMAFGTSQKQFDGSTPTKLRARHELNQNIKTQMDLSQVNIFNDVVDVSSLKNLNRNRKDAFQDQYKTASGKQMMTNLQEEQFATLEEALHGKKLFLLKPPIKKVDESPTQPTTQLGHVSSAHNELYPIKKEQLNGLLMSGKLLSIAINKNHEVQKHRLKALNRSPRLQQEWITDKQFKQQKSFTVAKTSPTSGEKTPYKLMKNVELYSPRFRRGQLKEEYKEQGTLNMKGSKYDKIDEAVNQFQNRLEKGNEWYQQQQLQKELQVLEEGDELRGVARTISTAQIQGMDVEEQTELRINDVPLEIQKRLLERRQTFQVQKDAKETIKILDKRLLKRQKEYDEASGQTKEQMDLVKRRLQSSIIDLKSLQMHPDSLEQGHNAINCGVRQKVKQYLKDKEKDKEFIGQIYPSQVFRTQLSHVRQHHHHHHQRHASVCNHYETLDNITENELKIWKQHADFTKTVNERAMILRQQKILQKMRKQNKRATSVFNRRNDCDI